MRLGVHIRDGEVTAWLRHATVELGPTGMRRLMRSLASQQLASTLENFEKQAFGDEAWAPLAEATQAKERKGGQTGLSAPREGNILHPEGTHLLQTISSESTEVYARVFTPCPWAHVHNEGADLEATAFGDITLPARTFLALTDADVEAIGEAVEWHLGYAMGG